MCWTSSVYSSSRISSTTLVAARHPRRRSLAVRKFVWSIIYTDPPHSSPQNHAPSRHNVCLVFTLHHFFALVLTLSRSRSLSLVRSRALVLSCSRALVLSCSRSHALARSLSSPRSLAVTRSHWLFLAFAHPLSHFLALAPRWSLFRLPSRTHSPWPSVFPLPRSSSTSLFHFL